MATIQEIRALHVMARDYELSDNGQPLWYEYCQECEEGWPCERATLLAALDEAQSVIEGLTADVQSYQTDVVQPMVEQIARDAPVLAAAEALEACIVQWPGYVPFLRADDEEAALVALAAAVKARRAATTPTP